MDWYVMFALVLGVAVGLLFLGVPVFVAFTLVNLLGIYTFWGGWQGLLQLSHSIFSAVANFVLLPIPAFIFLGEILAQSGVFGYAIEVIDKWIGRVRGRLTLLAIASATVFAALSGSAQGTAALIGRTLLPEMYKRGYDKSLALGSCLSGALAMIIPPSAFAVILASLAEVSVGKVLIGGIIPGLILAWAYTAFVLTYTRFFPEAAKDYVAFRYSWREKITGFLKYVLPFGGIMLVVTGFVILGVCTPSEAAVLGAAASVVFVAIYRKFSWGLIKSALGNTARITIMMFMILTGAMTFSQILSYTGASQGLCQFVTEIGLSPLVLVLIMQLVYTILGCFMEQVAILMITFPIFLPVLKTLEVDILWFSILTLVNMGIAMKSPPFGLTLFVVQGVAPEGTRIGDVYKGAFWFCLLDLGVLIILIAFPKACLFLPNLLKGG